MPPIVTRAQALTALDAAEFRLRNRARVVPGWARERIVIALRAYADDVERFDHGRAEALRAVVPMLEPEDEPPAPSRREPMPPDREGDEELLIAMGRMRRERS